MRIPWFFRRYIWFVIVLLIIIPLSLSLFIQGASYHYQLRAVYLLQRLYLIFSGLLLVFFLISSRKISGFKPEAKMRAKRRDWKEPTVFALLAGLFFILAFSSQLDYDKILSQGVGVTDRVNFDAERWLAPEILSDVDVNPSAEYGLAANDGLLLRQLAIDIMPENPAMMWYSKWEDRDRDGALASCSIFLGVNNGSILFDVTPRYAVLRPGEKTWLRIMVEKEYLRPGDNFLFLRKNCSEPSPGKEADTIFIYAQGVYVGLGTHLFDGALWKTQPFSELLLFVKEESSFSDWLLFKLGFIFRVLAVLCLFISFFGLGFFVFLIRKAKLELGFSFVYAILMYWFSQYIRQYWLVLSKVVSYGAYFLLKLSFLKPVLDFSDPTLPSLGAAGLRISMADTCSGIESMAYFILAYSVLIAINWRFIDWRKAVLLFIPGLLGTILVNTLRIYFLFLIGAFISEDFALNAYHTNAGMVFFVIYFILFWQLFFSGKKRKKKRKS